MSHPRQASLPLFLLFLLLSQAGCLGSKPEPAPEGEHMYVDAARGFAIDHPVSWSRVKSLRERSTVRWRGPASSGEAPPEAAVHLLPQEGSEKLLADFQAAHPDASVVDRSERTLPAGDALQVNFQTAERRFLVFLLSNDSRAFLLEFSARAERLEELLPLFEKMALSFRSLGGK